MTTTPTKNESLPELPVSQAMEEAAFESLVKLSGAFRRNGRLLDEAMGREIGEARIWRSASNLLNNALSAMRVTPLAPVVLREQMLRDKDPQLYVHIRGPVDQFGCRVIDEAALTREAPTEGVGGGIRREEDWCDGCPTHAELRRLLDKERGIVKRLVAEDDERFAQEQAATQPPHHDRGDDLQQARELLALELRNRGMATSAGVVRREAMGELNPVVVAALYVIAALTEAKQQGPGEASDEDIAAWLERHDLDHAIRGPDARAAFEDAQTFHMTQSPQVEAKRQTGEAESYALQAALSWINERGHGENCYLDPDHDLGKQCVCGKEAVVTLIEEASAAATNGKGD